MIEDMKMRKYATNNRIRSFPADRKLWIETRDEIYEEIMVKGYCEQRKVFTQFYEGHTLDASVLIMPLVFFASPTDPRFLSTVDQIRKYVMKKSERY